MEKNMMEQMKKDLQKIVKAYRDEQPVRMDYWGREHKEDYPKAMMGQAQMRKGTATINFGDRKNKNRMADEFSELPSFKAFCEKYSVRVAGRETHDDYEWLRINY